MKRILAALLCALLLCAVPICAFAEDEVIDSAEADGTIEDNLTTEEDAPDVGDIWEGEVPEVDNSVTDSVMEGLEEEEKNEIRAMADYIVKYIEEHSDTITLFFTVVISIFYQMKKHGLLNKSISTLNNNSITVAENSASFIQQAMTIMTGAVTALNEFKATIAELLEAYKQTAEDNKALNARLKAIDAHLENAKKANVEFSNELAELLVLANIPNSKKDELYSRHRAAVALLETAEVTADEGKEE